MRFCALASGSGGNAWLFESGGKAILVDCGLSYRKLRERFDAVEFSPYDVQAVLVSHAHGDHRQALRKFVTTHGCSIWCTGQTAEQIPWLVENPHLVSVMEMRDTVQIEPFTVKSLPTLHDSLGAVTFSISDGEHKVATVLESGRVTAEMKAEAIDADAVLVEANHDPQLVADSVERYKAWRRHDPDKLDPCPKGAIPEDVGVFILTRHLSNGSCGLFLKTTPLKRCKLIVLCHLSRDRNTPGLALATVKAALKEGGQEIEVVCAEQDDPVGWYDLQSLQADGIKAEVSAGDEW